MVITTRRKLDVFLILGHEKWTFYSTNDRRIFGIVWNISTVCNY